MGAVAEGGVLQEVGLRQAAPQFRGDGATGHRISHAPEEGQWHVGAGEDLLDPVAVAGALGDVTQQSRYEVGVRVSRA